MKHIILKGIFAFAAAVLRAGLSLRRLRGFCSVFFVILGLKYCDESKG